MKLLSGLSKKEEINRLYAYLGCLEEWITIHLGKDLMESLRKGFSINQKGHGVMKDPLHDQKSESALTFSHILPLIDSEK